MELGSSDRSHYDAALGSLEAEVQAIHKRLDSIAADIRSAKGPKAHIYAITVAATGVLVTIFTLALNPVSRGVAELSTALFHQSERFHLHTSDGHPDAVINMIDTLDKQHERERKRLQDSVHTIRKAIDRDEDRVDEIMQRLTALETIADERTERFKKALGYRDERIDERARDRWTGAEQKVYSRAIEQRLKALEKGFGQSYVQ